MDNKLNFNKVIDNKDLVSESTYNCINNIFSDEEKNNILVASIDS